jgi:hypothetical protein
MVGNSKRQEPGLRDLACLPRCSNIFVDSAATIVKSDEELNGDLDWLPSDRCDQLMIIFCSGNLDLADACTLPRCCDHWGL